MGSALGCVSVPPIPKHPGPRRNNQPVSQQQGAGGSGETLNDNGEIIARGNNSTIHQCTAVSHTSLGGSGREVTWWGNVMGGKCWKYINMMKMMT